MSSLNTEIILHSILYNKSKKKSRAFIKIIPERYARELRLIKNCRGLSEISVVIELFEQFVHIDSIGIKADAPRSAVRCGSNRY